MMVGGGGGGGGGVRGRVAIPSAPRQTTDEAENKVGMPGGVGGSGSSQEVPPSVSLIYQEV